MANVIFKTGTKALYDALLTKDPNTLYWLTDVQQLYKGDVLFGIGVAATAENGGLMSAEDKAKLDGLSENRADAVAVEFELEKQDTPEPGCAATYKMKRTAGEEVTYVGATLNILESATLKSGSMKVVTETDQPYEGAEVGDPYIELVLNDEDSTKICIPASALVDTYTAGNGIEVQDYEISVKLDTDNANGLSVGENGIFLNLATDKNAGAFSAEDKIALNTVVNDVEELKESTTWGNLSED